MTARGDRAGAGGRLLSRSTPLPAVLFLAALGVTALGCVLLVGDVGGFVRASTAPRCPGGQPDTDCRATVRGSIAGSGRAVADTLSGTARYWHYDVLVDQATLPQAMRTSNGRLRAQSLSTRRTLQEGDPVTLTLFGGDTVEVATPEGEHIHAGDARGSTIGHFGYPVVFTGLAFMYWSAPRSCAPSAGRASCPSTTTTHGFWRHGSSLPSARSPSSPRPSSPA